ncbi:unnamed protein product [Malus baccata var. baccata]|uniref:Uncharacterized protein n=1 Tax=Malus domestica TaxID=3750 RepID=A0A498J7U9_MALDO|nr:hypothetical protein DVH24_032240 [Malus domestica]
MRLLQQHAKNQLGSFSQANKFSSSSSVLVSSFRQDKLLDCGATVGVVEALKDQGVCRWNDSITLMHQHAKNHLTRLFSQAKELYPSPSAASRV